jgi:rfaE bifunctional protein nucleotidyltransferase chain/domain
VIKDKLKSLKQLQNMAVGLKAKRKRIVFTNGCFDLLHYGHVQYLEKAKDKGDYLIVGINTDSSVKRLKGQNRPIVGQADRVKTIAGLESVDYVVLFSEDTPIKLIKAIKPDVLIKGGDWQAGNIVGKGFVDAYGGKVLTIRLARGRSTSKLINKIVSRF